MSTPEAPSRVRLVLVLTRALVVAVLIVVLFYLVPLRLSVDVGTFIRLVVGLLALALLTAWQLRGIARSPYPALRAIETLAVLIPLFLLLFAAAYTLMSQAQPASFSEEMSRTDAVYFSVTVFATVGFGDISPVSDPARVVVTIQMIADLLVLGFVLQAVVDAVSRGRARLSGAGPAEPEAR
ncbi:potassium channel family protein [Actinomycetospora sp. CA-101289]|uniref:potassium channel family protein n=1 Tax=Actinomycetospora sp. CA-101289 TaxID=3239893 RepID=UPI003D97D5F1